MAKRRGSQLGRQRPAGVTLAVTTAVFNRLIVLTAATVGVAVAAAPCHAQEANRFAVGVNYTKRVTGAEHGRADGGVGIKWRLGHTRPGWSPQFGLGWFAIELEREVAGRTVGFGELKVRPVVGGYGYTFEINPKTHVTAEIVGGLAFTSFSLADEADRAFRSLPDGPVTADFSSVIPIVRPEVSLWYDVHPKFGVSVGAGYSIARPKLTIASAGAQQTERLRADTFALSVGLVYKVF